jgi:DNA polymerase (family 10)
MEVMRERSKTSAGGRLVDRAVVAAVLREIGGLLELTAGNRFRAQAYERGAQAIEAVPGDLAEMVRTGRLTSVPGIGSGLAKTIVEVIETGRSSLLERLREGVPPGAAELGRVLSLSRIRALHDALGITTLEELRHACEAGRVRGVTGFGEKTERRLLERLDALASRSEMILLPEADRQAAFLRSHLTGHPAVRRVEIAGALRRRVETIERIDVVVETDDAAAVLAHAARLPAAVVTPDGDDTVVVRRPGAVQARVCVGRASSFGVAWVRATGSGGHVERLEARAAARGVAFDRGGRATADETAVYEKLGLPFIAPELREDAGEIDAADAGTLPDDLVRVEDIQGAVHCHTVYSDGKHTIEDMARAAEALGLRYLTITDHSPSATYAGGLDIDRLRRQWDEIARVQERVAVRLLRGTESDILREGALDHPDAVLDRLEVVIASVHQRHGLDSRAMTRRLVRALGHPRFKIWGHALGRYVLTRPPFECDMDAVLDAVAASRAAIEVNGDPHRLDLEPRWIRAARQRGIRFVVSSDAHSVEGLRNARFGVDMARRGWLRRSDVLNTLGPDDFAAAVRP